MTDDRSVITKVSEIFQKFNVDNAVCDMMLAFETTKLGFGL